ncbi:hypothetical protein [Marinilactibacillus kalidii]|uniref:hypothetical protein n=1 Tax=Marinilactibacillus kalidii TaxID=2820274 RepID=UPI001ABE0094|nr:hypothetical protein [Marinilactibacillus kalidii]
MKSDQAKSPLKSGEQNERYQIKLSYLTNAEETKRIGNIDFPENPNIRLDSSSRTLIDELENTQAIRNQKHFDIYRLREVFVSVRDYSDEYDHTDNVLRKATIYFTDGSETHVDLGEIHLNHNEKREGPLELYSTILFDGVLENKFEVAKKVTLTDTNMNQLTDYEGLLDIQIDGVPISEAEGMTFSPESTVMITSEMKSSKNRLTEFTQIDFTIEATFADEEGNKFTQQISSVINEENDYGFWDVHDYIKIRGEE